MESESIGIGDYPLLVKVQTIDIQGLDTKTIGAFKPKNVTCIEASNLLIFVGVTSGTVYVFSRETRAYKYMIPFTGGKVCCISCSENEKEVAIGSIRGIVSIYELIKERPIKVRQTKSTPAPAFFKYIATVQHHKGNEITELLWSPNGKYLFVGDTQGIVSQTDVGGYNDQRPMSEVILKLKSRVIQIQFLFPFLAICTVSAVFLGDIENEDFARIQFGSKSKEEIQATGLALVLADLRLNETHATVYLYVSEMKTGMLHRFNLQGQLLESQKITIDSKSQAPITSFDPIDISEEILSTTTYATNKSKDVNPVVSLGKLMLSDENLLLSVSQNNLYVIDPTKMKLVYWNDEFRKIQNSKLQSNYVFLWSSARVIVLSLTPLFPYAEQLFNAGTTVPFQRWIHHCLVAIGWKPTQEEDSETNLKVIDDFCTAFHLRGNNGSNTIDFRQSISLQIPFAIPQQESKQQPEEMERDIERPTTNPQLNLVGKLLEAFEEYETGREKILQENGNSCNVQSTANIWTAIEAFYSSVAANMSLLDSSKSPTLMQAITKIENGWIMESTVVNLYNNLVTTSTAEEVQLLNESILNFLKAELSNPDYISNHTDQLDSPIGSLHPFSSFVCQNFVTDWFGELGISKLQAYQDALYADMLLVLIPFLSPEMRNNLGTKLGSSHGFSTWLLLSTFYNVGQLQNPYEMQLKSLFSSGTTPSYQFVKTIFNSIYGDLVQSNLRPLQNSLHHLVSLLYFITDPEDVVRQEGVSKQNGILSLLISSFPLKHWSREKIFPKLTSLCRSNSTLLKMYEAACLFSIRDTKFCRCGIPAECGPERFISSTASSSTGMSTFLSTVKEVVIDLRMGHLRSIIARSKLERHVLTSTEFPFKLTMARKIIDGFWTSHYQLLDETTLMELMLRMGSCPLLNVFPMTKSRISALLQRRDSIIQNQTCDGCGDALVVAKDFASISTECLGMTIFNNHCFQSLDKFRQLVEEVPGLNSPGMFSLRFYQEIASSLAKGQVHRDNTNYTNGFGRLTNISCECFHTKH